jgi:hypothetical protein
LRSERLDWSLVGIARNLLGIETKKSLFVDSFLFLLMLLSVKDLETNQVKYITK